MDIKTIENYKKAGRIAAEALEFGKSLIKKNASMLEVCEKTEDRIFSLGGKPAFPVQISLNHIAAHYCPEQDDNIILNDQLACIDVGVHIDGCIGDNAATIDLSGNNKEIVEASKKALDEAIKVIAPGVMLGEIGRVIHEAITSYGFSPVRNLSGHGLSKYNIHDKPTIPNFDTGDKTKLQKGIVIAVEPFASSGAGIVHETGTASVFSMVTKKPVRSPITREVLREIESYDGLPFSKRWLTKKFGAKANFALRDLLQLDIIRGYPPLSDIQKGLVSQAEHSLLIDDEVIILTRS